MNSVWDRRFNFSFQTEQHLGLLTVGSKVCWQIRKL